MGRLRIAVRVRKVRGQKKTITRSSKRTTALAAALNYWYVRVVYNSGSRVQ